MEDYKEKLKEALNSDNTDYEVVRWIEQNFPELKESEDEKVRKEVIDFICWATNRGSITSEQREKSNSWIAWLEKQGSTSWILPDDAFWWNKVIERYNGLKMDIRQEAISAEVQEKNLNDELNWINSLCKKACTEQKPGWSEEDETTLNNLIYALANDRIGCCRDEYVDWLKSIKDRVQPQPKQEWSEDDEKLFEEIKRCVGIQYPLGNPSIFKFLKSLRPQNRWKPSEEQMNNK